MLFREASRSGKIEANVMVTRGQSSFVKHSGIGWASLSSRATVQGNDFCNNRNGLKEPTKKAPAHLRSNAEGKVEEN